DRVYKCLRAQARLAHLMQDESGRALVIGSLALIDGLAIDAISEAFSGEGYAPSPLTDEERRRISADPGEAPAWLEAGLPGFVADRLKTVYGDQWLIEAEALMLPRAPIDLRVNGDDRDSLKQGLEMLGYKPALTPFSALGLRLPSEPPPNVRALPAFGQGRIEIQDEGSQLAGFLVGAEPGMTVIDYCAGGGGKTLAMLQAMGGQGRLIASDVEKTRLNNIRPRLKRAGLEADLRQLGADGEGMEDLVGLADRVLVDAPCSGSGVWRRRPETAHALTEAEVLRLHALQVTILERAARLVKPGGRLVYATCSILPDENEQSAAAFASAHPEFTPLSVDAALAVPQISPDGGRQLSTLAAGGHTLRLSPAATQTDGFFVALFERKA
ncbi:MAG: RsmB/NOP family class I SAM-dependent RNA methyltransferase, partial [Asticcacaulis sp.]